MKKIKKMSTVKLDPIQGSVTDTLNVEDKITNAPSIRLMMDIAHPIGSYYWSSESTSPETLFGGTWEAVEGKFIFASGTIGRKEYAVGDTGGSADAIIPYHNHIFTGTAASHSHPLSSSGVSTFTVNGSGSKTATNCNITGTSNSTNSTINQIIAASKSLTPKGTVEYAGTSGNVTEANMPPYEVAYCWKRIA